ncbi:hypothetical protein PR003_g451 [Phytophthora rubi]|uniref:RxLR effector protein n=1 Tax=Phytophthora rubi TaxID=129364 RepID=A0A6A3P7Z3_9STRA|nr:hypothetical protein PR002_g186 [Phytophthora rubi]KAE9359989.1 hypothetical protein PR003_g451 [Phytophthora rubi]
MLVCRCLGVVLVVYYYSSSTTMTQADLYSLSYSAGSIRRAFSQPSSGAHAPSRMTSNNLKQCKVSTTTSTE